MTSLPSIIVDLYQLANSHGKSVLCAKVPFLEPMEKSLESDDGSVWTGISNETPCIKVA